MFIYIILPKISVGNNKPIQKITDSKINMEISVTILHANNKVEQKEI